MKTLLVALTLILCVGGEGGAQERNRGWNPPRHWDGYHRSWRHHYRPEPQVSPFDSSILGGIIGGFLGQVLRPPPPPVYEREPGQ